MLKNKKHKIALSILTAGLVLTLTGCTIVEKPEPTQESTTEPTTETTTEITTEITTTSTTTPVSTTNIPEESVKVWATQDVHIRENPSANSKILGILHEGNGIIRTQKTSDGWSKVVYNGIEAYISTSYLTEKEPTKTVVSDRIVVTLNLDWFVSQQNIKQMHHCKIAKN